MKKLFLLFSILISTVIFSQRMGKSKTQLNAGFYTNTGMKNVTPLYIGADFGVAQELSLGGQFDMYFYNGGSLKFLNAHANYHFGNLFNAQSEWDIYAGVALIMGLQGDNPIDLGGQFGVRYFFSRVTGINFEVGLQDHYTPIKLGLTFNI